MSVIVELRVAGEDFELGRALDPLSGVQVECDRPIAGSERPLPFWVDGGADGVASALSDQDRVQTVRRAAEFDHRSLYAMEWQPNGERLLDAAAEAGANLVECRTDTGEWVVGLRFFDEAATSAFADWCAANDLEEAFEQRYAPEPDSAYGLTERQRETMVLAIESGYYDIPRTTTTKELAEQFGISDQAVTERLRRAIRALAGSTLLSGSR
jgi:predicted DNA binding protein